MKKFPSQSDLVRLPAKAQLALFLIAEELKSRKFFTTLREVGLDYTFFQPHLDDAILDCLGLDICSDEVFDLYYRVIEKRSGRIKDDRDSVMKQALKVYLELQNQKRKGSQP